MTLIPELKCPHCGALIVEVDGLVEVHDLKPFRQVCPGSQQVARGLADRRKLWSEGGEP